MVEWILLNDRTATDPVRTRFEIAVSGSYNSVVQVFVDLYPKISTPYALVLAAKHEHEMTLKILLDARRQVPLPHYGDRIKNCLFEAFEEAQTEGLDDAARLLERYWKEEK